MEKPDYNIMPLSEIHDLRELCNQIGKRAAKGSIDILIDDCDKYGIDLDCAFEVFRKELSKQLKRITG